MEEREKLIHSIRTLIQKSGMKQKAIAQKCGFSEQEFSNMLNGRKVIMGEHIPAIAKALGVTPNEIYGKAS